MVSQVYHGTQYELSLTRGAAPAAAPDDSASAGNVDGGAVSSVSTAHTGPN
jgi:hypothetical protein